LLPISLSNRLPHQQGASSTMPRVRSQNSVLSSSNASSNTSSGSMRPLLTGMGKLWCRCRRFFSSSQFLLAAHILPMPKVCNNSNTYFVLLLFCVQNLQKNSILKNSWDLKQKKTNFFIMWASLIIFLENCS
jgi:hypothetical protein